MMTVPLSEATVRLHCRNAKRLFGEALTRELVTRNPFKHLKSSAIAANRDFYLSAADTATVLHVCPMIRWRALFALCRFAGLRCPSETHGLLWRQVDFDLKTLTVYAPKTDSTRIVPITGDLLDVLQEAWDMAPEGAGL